MTTNQQVIEMHTLIKCGWCGKDNFTKELTEPETSFLKNCQCCNKLCYNHKFCAKAYVKQEMKKKDPEFNVAVSIESFNQCRIPFYCQECNQIECFVCNRKHTQSKYIYIYIYLLQNYVNQSTNNHQLLKNL